jgi:hypothetical protein
MQEDKFLELQEALLQAREDYLGKEKLRLQEIQRLQDMDSVCEHMVLTAEEEVLVDNKVNSLMESQQFKEGYLKSRENIRAEVVAEVLRGRER